MFLFLSCFLPRGAAPGGIVVSVLASQAANQGSFLGSGRILTCTSLVEKNQILGFIIRATTKVISRPRLRGFTWRDGDSNLGPPGYR